MKRMRVSHFLVNQSARYEAGKEPGPMDPYPMVQVWIAGCATHEQVAMHYAREAGQKPIRAYRDDKTPHWVVECE